MLETAKKILVVDDEPFALAIVERLLKQEGYTVHLAKNGSDALKICLKYKPDLVLLDLMMPGISGEEVCREIRTSCAEVKIVYFSAKQFFYSKVNFSDSCSQPDGFIAKPASSKLILSTVRNVLSGKNQKAGK